MERAYRDHADDVYRVAFSILRDQSTAVLNGISLAEAAQWEDRLERRTEAT